MAYVTEADWKRRCEAWGATSNPPNERRRRERSSEPLTLCGHGISLRVEGGTLLIKNGFTHYPQKQETFRFFRGDLDRPSRIIVLDGSGALTFDVLDWLAEQDVPLMRVNWRGEVITVAGGSGYGADREKIEWQRETRANPNARLQFSCDLIRNKISNSADTLEAAFPASGTRDHAIAKLRLEFDALGNAPPAGIDELRGVEGRASAAYFTAWQEMPLCWKSFRRKPHPSEWLNLGPRSSMRAGKKSKNRNATHPVNAMLNYAYAVAVGDTKLKALSEGYDPTIGIMHHGYRESPAFALDLVEPMRPLVDRAVLGFALSNELHPADFTLRADGACRINPQMARQVVDLTIRSGTK